MFYACRPPASLSGLHRKYLRGNAPPLPIASPKSPHYIRFALGTFRRDHSHVIGAKLAYGRPLPIKYKAERTKGFYQANFALEELLGGSVAFPAEANGLARALGSNGRQSYLSQTKREVQQSLALLMFAILFLLLALTIQRRGCLAFWQ